MHPSWKTRLSAEFSKPYFKSLAKFVEAERKSYSVWPVEGEVFRAFEVTSYDNANVVILGQDPYYGVKQANGLSFSIKRGAPLQPSLVNIFKELNSDLGIPMPKHGDLLRWAEQGVLLLNTVLTVRERIAGSHRDHGWEIFTDEVIKILNDRERPVVFVLWGLDAAAKRLFIDDTKHVLIEASHPSPYSAHRGFTGSKPFSRINQALEKFGHPTIDWNLI